MDNRTTSHSDIPPAARHGYAPVNGLELYYEVHGEGQPLILLHGGFGAGEMFAPLLPQLTAGRQVITVDLQAHGHTADIDRPLSLEAMADDVAFLVQHLGLAKADVMGYSMGGGTALQVAIRHPGVVRKLVVVSFPFKRDAWFPDVRQGMEQVGPQSAEMMKQSPMYELYARIAPRPEDFTVLVTKMGDLIRRDYDWSGDVAAIEVPTLVVAADADGFPPSHPAEFYGLLGGAKEDPGWDRAKMPSSRLAILPGTTHYDCLDSPLLAPVVTSFLDAPG